MSMGGRAAGRRRCSVGSGVYEVFIRRYLPDDPDVDPTAEPETEETGTVPKEATI